MTSSPDLIHELRASRPSAPTDLRTRIRELAAEQPAPARRAGWRFPVRRGALIAVPAAVALALAAAGVLGLTRSNVPTRVSGENAPTPVLVAKQLIPTGTPGSIVATNGMYAATTLPQKEVEVGAVADPSYLAGRAAAADIFPGQQITSTDFAASDTASVDSQVTGLRAQRVTATLSVEVKDSDAVSRAAQDALDLTRSLGGYVVNSSVVTGEQGTASLTVRVPVARVQDAIAGLSALGRIVSQQVTVDDLQEQLDQLQRQRASLVEQITRITARLESEDLDAQTTAALEARRRALRSELRAVRSQIAGTNAEARMSTIQLTVVTPDSSGAVVPGSRIDRTVDEALNVLAWEGVVALGMLIVLAPFALVGLAVWLGRRLYRRHEEERLLAT
jgi:Domain of unknown function (DUF4349)